MRIFAVVRGELLCRLRNEPPHLALAASVIALGALALLSLWLIEAVAPHPTPFGGFSSPGFPATSGWDKVLVSYRADLLFLILSLGIAALVIVIGPIAGGATLNHEGDHSAVESLLLTGLNPLTIVAGKFLAALVRTFLILSAGLPAFAVAWLFGGVSFSVVALNLGAIAALALLGVSLGLFMSSVFRSGVVAAFSSYAFLGLVTIAFPTLLLVAIALGADSWWHSWLLLSMPVAALGTHGELLAAVQNLMPLPVRQLLLPSTDAGTPVSLAYTFLAATIGGYLAASGILVVLTSIVLDPFHPIRAFRPRLSQRGAKR